MFTDRRGKNSLTSTFINTQENLIGTRKLTQQDIQTRSQFTKKSRNNANNNATEHFPHSSNTYNSKKIQHFRKRRYNPQQNRLLFQNTKKMDYQTFKPVTTSRQTTKQKTSNRNNFSDHSCNFFCKIQNNYTPYMNSQNQSQAQNDNQNVPQQAFHTAFFNDQLQTTTDCSENYHFIQQNKIMTNKHHSRNQPNYSENEDYHSHNQQRLSTNQQNNNWNIDQPYPFLATRYFEPYT